jgi:RNA polymerase sigma factor (sigma-70 family)
MPEQPEIDWKEIVERIQNGDPAASEILYQAVANGARLFFQRRLGIQDVEDRVHDLFVTVVESIRRGEVEYPERIMGFVRTILNRQLSRGIQTTIRSRRVEAELDPGIQPSSAELTPEQEAVAAQQVELMKTVLRQMSDRDFDVLTRFYLRDQTPDVICHEMNLTQVQFNLLKSRAKARLTDLMRQKLGRQKN